MPKTAKPRKTWVYAPKKPTPPKVPESLKREVEMKANALIEGEWIEIFPDLTLDECLEAVRDDPWFHP